MEDLLFTVRLVYTLIKKSDNNRMLKLSNLGVYCCVCVYNSSIYAHVKKNSYIYWKSKQPLKMISLSVPNMRAYGLFHFILPLIFLLSQKL